MNNIAYPAWSPTTIVSTPHTLKAHPKSRNRLYRSVIPFLRGRKQTGRMQLTRQSSKRFGKERESNVEVRCLPAVMITNTALIMTCVRSLGFISPRLAIAYTSLERHNNPVRSQYVNKVWTENLLSPHQQVCSTME